MKFFIYSLCLLLVVGTNYGFSFRKRGNSNYKNSPRIDSREVQQRAENRGYLTRNQEASYKKTVNRNVNSSYDLRRVDHRENSVNPKEDYSNVQNDGSFFESFPGVSQSSNQRNFDETLRRGNDRRYIGSYQKTIAKNSGRVSPRGVLGRFKQVKKMQVPKRQVNQNFKKLGAGIYRGEFYARGSLGFDLDPGLQKRWGMTKRTK